VHNDDKLTHTQFQLIKRPNVQLTNFVKVLHTLENFVEIGRAWTYYIRKNVPIPSKWCTTEENFILQTPNEIKFPILIVI
jgi:hypothetical protein